MRTFLIPNNSTDWASPIYRRDESQDNNLSIRGGNPWRDGSPFVKNREEEQRGSTSISRLLKEGLLMSVSFFLPPNHRVFSMSALLLPSFSPRFRYFERLEQFPGATEPSATPFFVYRSQSSWDAATLFAGLEQATVLPIRTWLRCSNDLAAVYSGN